MKKATFGTALFAIAVLALAALACGSSPEPEATPFSGVMGHPPEQTLASERVYPTATLPRPTETPWFPDGYTQYDSTTALRWMDPGEFDCTYSGARCWGLFVVTKNGCDSLYVELSLESESGANVGYTNAITSGLRPLQVAEMIFDSFESRASMARVSNVSCY